MTTLSTKNVSGKKKKLKDKKQQKSDVCGSATVYVSVTQRFLSQALRLP